MGWIFGIDLVKNCSCFGKLFKFIRNIRYSHCDNILSSMLQVTCYRRLLNPISRKYDTLLENISCMNNMY